MAFNRASIFLVVVVVIRVYVAEAEKDPCMNCGLKFIISRLP